MNFCTSQFISYSVRRVSLVLVAALISSMVSADDRAIEIIDAVEELYRGESSFARMTMIVETPQYQRTMEMESSSIGTEKAFIRILAPRKDRGIATLKLDLQMWNYLPKINKVIKVPPSMMMGSWMGSDFTNDDLVKQTTLTEEYSLTMEEADDQYRIILVPKSNTVTVWGKIDYVVNKEPLMPLTQNFYDDNGRLIRKMEFSEPREIANLLIPTRMEMIPMNKEGHKTIIIYDELQFNPPEVDESVFTLRNLRSRF